MSATAPSSAATHAEPRTRSARPRALFVATDAATLRAFLLPFATHFRERGWRVDAMAARTERAPECAEAFDTVWQVSWSRGISGAADLSAVREVRRIVTEGRYDLVHVHTPVAAALTRFALRRMRTSDRPVRVIYTAHGFHFRDGPTRAGRVPFRLVEQVAGRWTDHLIVINDADEELARRYRLVPPEHLEHMPGIGIDTTYFDRTQVDAETIAEVRDAHGIPSDAPVLTLIAEFSPRKRHADAIDAMARLVTEDVHLLLVGGGSAGRKQAIIDRVGHHGLTGRVHLVGRVPDVRPYILAADALLQVSDREGLPRSVMEAMALGVPVVGSDTPGTRDLLEDGRGTLVPVGRVDVLAAAIDRILRDGSGGATEAALEHVREQLGLEIILARHERTYEQLLTAVAP